MRLAARGVPALACPLTRIERVEPPPEPPADVEAWVFTSANAVPASAPEGARAYCVGASTARRARRAGFEAFEAGGDAAALGALLRVVPERRFFQPRGRHLARDLGRDLVGSGKTLAEAVAYEAVAVEALPDTIEADLAAGRLGVVGFWSPRAGRVWSALAGGVASAELEAVAISENAARSLAGLGFASVGVAARPDGPAMLDALERAARA